MKERIARQVGPERRASVDGNLSLHVPAHSACRGRHIGFTSQFTIYDTADSKSLIRSIIKEMGLDEKVYKPGMVQARISNAKNHLVSPAAMPTTRRLTKETVQPRFRRFATSTRDIGSVAGRQMRWTSTICCSTHSCCSGTTRGVGALSGPVPLHSGR